jgi:hypothetical protein
MRLLDLKKEQSRCEGGCGNETPQLFGKSRLGKNEFVSALEKKFVSALESVSDGRVAVAG